jgi:hypothetical protein
VIRPADLIGPVTGMRHGACLRWHNRPMLSLECQTLCLCSSKLAVPCAQIGLSSPSRVNGVRASGDWSISDVLVLSIIVEILISYGGVDHAECGLLGYHHEIANGQDLAILGRCRLRASDQKFLREIEDDEASQI